MLYFDFSAIFYKNYDFFSKPIMTDLGHLDAPVKNYNENKNHI